MNFQKITAGLLSVFLLAGTSVPALADTASDAVTAAPQIVNVNYADIEFLVRSGNQTIRANEKTLDSLNSNDAAGQKQQELAASRASLQSVSDQLQSAYNAVAALPSSPEQQAIASSLQGSLASIAAIRSILSAQSDQLDVSEDTIDQTELQMNDAADQIVVTAQKLYVTFHYLNAERNQLLKQQQALDDTLKITQLKADLGLITQTDLLNARQQKNTLADTLTALANQMRTVKNNLQVLLGYSSDYDLSISSAPSPDANFSAAVNEAADRQTAQSANWTLKEKKLAKEIADDDKDSDLDSTVDDYRAASLNYSLALNTFNASFQQVYNDVAEKQSRLASAQAAYDAKTKTLDAVKLQNILGIASALELKNAQTDLDSAQAALDQAKLNLFSSQEQYRWALRGVISTSSTQEQSSAQG
ncbi:TolC family protein [Caproiciproducens sp. R2]|uniref:TolC family protein n=1 Tax=Caproiciproducens sp. R2 TaxID=3435187 RepID=UPI00403319B0